MGAFLAFLELRQYCAQHPEISLLEAETSVKTLKGSAIGLDFPRAMVLVEHLDESKKWDATRTGLRRFVGEWVRLTQPYWLRFVPYGRESVRPALSSDEAQCFREAGLLDETPDNDAIQWWDDIATLVRGEVDARKMERARLAERLSYEYELNRIATLGIDRAPKWMSLEDNSLGYDILSYDVSAGEIINLLIEVKSTLSDTIILTRGEWANAESAPDKTRFHVWKLPGQEFHEINASSIAPHIPLEKGRGMWLDLEIKLDI